MKNTISNRFMNYELLFELARLPLAKSMVRCLKLFVFFLQFGLQKHIFILQKLQLCIQLMHLIDVFFLRYFQCRLCYLFFGSTNCMEVKSAMVGDFEFN